MTSVPVPPEVPLYARENGSLWRITEVIAWWPDKGSFEVQMTNNGSVYLTQIDGVEILDSSHWLPTIVGDLNQRITQYVVFVEVEPRSCLIGSYPNMEAAKQVGDRLVNLYEDLYGKNYTTWKPVDMKYLTLDFTNRGGAERAPIRKSKKHPRITIETVTHFIKAFEG